MENVARKYWEAVRELSGQEPPDGFTLNLLGHMCRSPVLKAVINLINMK